MWPKGKRPWPIYVYIIEWNMLGKIAKKIGQEKKELNQKFTKESFGSLRDLLETRECGECGRRILLAGKEGENVLHFLLLFSFAPTKRKSGINAKSENTFFGGK